MNKSVVSVTWGYKRPGDSGKHIPGETYTWEHIEGAFTQDEAKRDAILKLQEEYPGVTDIKVKSRYVKEKSDMYTDIDHEEGYWYAKATGRT